MRSAAVMRMVPFHHGMRFQITVSERDRPASCMKRWIASAVALSLSRLMKPDPFRPGRAGAAVGPGFSSRNRICAPMPPSRGSKSGTSVPGRMRRRAA